MCSTIASSLFAVALLLFGNTASAVPADPRAVTESPLDPRVSVNAIGKPIATITPFISTANGIATTVSAAPAALTAPTTSSKSDSKPTETSVNTGGGSYQVCHNTDADFAPLCKPSNSTTLYVGQTYYVTWDATSFSAENETVIIVANYLNASNSGPVAFSSATIDASVGFYLWKIENDWLQGESLKNITLWINPMNPIDGQALSLGGSNFGITNKPADYYRALPTQAPKGQELYIALPLFFGVLILCVCGVSYFNRKHRKIDLGKVMGRRRGYGIGKSNRERLGLRKRNDGSIELQDLELTAGGQYRDSPLWKAMADSDVLGSVAGTPTGERQKAL
ncbi:Protein of unknown function (DUF4448) domain containing protein [Hyaloscypha variabilis]